MNIDILVAEIGSTTTVINGFSDINTNPLFIGQGIAPTTVLQGDVTIGIEQALDDLKSNLKVASLEYNEFYATSSAAGGLKMTVHGLVYDMTARAAKEAALGAGANIHSITAGKLRPYDLKKIKRINPNIILIAGGVDYGERETVLYNAGCILELDFNIPIIYAGNIENKEEIEDLFEEAGKQVYVVDNVYPKIDQLNIVPTRKMIQQVFEEHITKAPGMKKVRDRVGGHIIPTPGAVMLAAQLLEKELGDLVVIDVGGATTDVHSVTNGSDEINNILLNPEPVAKRTVEGDLGVYINKDNIIDKIGRDTLAKQIEVTPEHLDELIDHYLPIPKTEEGIKLSEALTAYAVYEALVRHAGHIRTLYGPSGKRLVAEGKDLSNVRTMIGTGGALTRLGGHILLKHLPLSNNSDKLLPDQDVNILIERDYIMASLGVISKKYPEAALKLLKDSLGIDK